MTQWVGDHSIPATNGRRRDARDLEAIAGANAVGEMSQIVTQGVTFHGCAGGVTHNYMIC